MKKIKFLAMLLLAVSMSFAFVSCGDDDDDNKIVNPINGGENVQIGVGEWTDDGSMISFTITDSYAGVSLQNTFYYGHSGNQITSYKMVSKCPNADIASQLKQDEEKDPESMAEIESLTQDGATLTYIYKESAYKGMTVEEVRAQYELFKSNK